MEKRTGNLKKFMVLLLSVLACNVSGQMESIETGSIQGVATDKVTGESLPGATIVLEGTIIGASADVDGRFIIPDLKPGTYNIRASYVSYNPEIIKGVVVEAGRNAEVSVLLSQDAIELQEVMVAAERKTNTESSVINTIKTSTLVSIGVSSQQILRSQDRDASEVIRRLPGTSVVDDRFIIVRGLAQRYNTVWLNNTATPGTEADVKAFSFDIIPASIIDNMMIIKSPAPELPADFSGGFIKIATVTTPEKNSFFVSYGTGFSEGTTFGSFLQSRTKNNNFLGFSNHKYDLPAAMPSHLGIYESASNTEILNRISILGRSLNNQLEPVKTTASPDQRFSAGFSRRFKIGSQSIGNITSLTYGNSNNYDRIETNNYSIYDFRNDRPSYNDEFADDQYSNSIKTGIMHNWTLYLPGNNKVEFRNLLNEIGQSKVTVRNGREWYNDGRYIRSFELKNLNRTIYSGQLAGTHSVKKTSIDWVAGYSYSAKNEPDIRRYRYIRSDSSDSDYFMLFSDNPDLSSQSRMWLNLSENLYSASLNISREYDLNGFQPEFKAGLYYEDKNRSFSARNFGYARSGNQSTMGMTFLPADEIFSEENINLTDGIRLSEITSLSDSYKASNNLVAAYMAVRLPIQSAVSIYSGIRVEKDIQTLSSYRQGTTIPVEVNRDTINVFPSANLSISINKNNLIRLAYGLSVNRPEFREMAPFYFVDFEQNAGIYGNPSIKDAYIHNFDIRFEHYPSANENLNIGVFYKSFRNPIEMVIVGNNPTQYSFENVRSAYSYGIETDVRKTFRFTPERDNFSFIMNAAFIRSRVDFAEGDLNPDRSLQGQSPFMINAGLFYYNDNSGFTVTALYNIIGRRIVAVGRPSPNSWESIPDVVEMPRNVIDLILNKKIGDHFEIKGSFKDILNQRILLTQTVDASVDLNDLNGPVRFVREQVTKYTKPGRNLSIGVSYKF
ncbi:MAG TPA: carboxypeptidase-like regulatory domain-containing protein [Bacteroidales bacterium]|nr:carboxypeptidase-like regulatory domain-containing protein [Bacteroidales bacterium]